MGRWEGERSAAAPRETGLCARPQEGWAGLSPPTAKYSENLRKSVKEPTWVCRPSSSVFRLFQ